MNYARLAEDAGFSFLSISDHYLPWIANHGHAGFAWCTIGGVSQATSRVRLSTGVTCPLMRYHPAIVAQAAATAATMMPGRFELGLGTGESLSEHIISGVFPTSEPVRLDMLREAVTIIRALWRGGMQDYYGTYYTLDNAQIYELPEHLPQIPHLGGRADVDVVQEVLLRETPPAVDLQPDEIRVLVREEHCPRPGERDRVSAVCLCKIEDPTPEPAAGGFQADPAVAVRRRRAVAGVVAAEVRVHE
ncbi:MAG: hypothetical protein PWR21_1521, partial [Methanoculleus sp.]|nr:hypothetical protein [Methanoculleus sp.]